MNKNDQDFIAQKIRTQYMEKQPSELDALRELDAVLHGGAFGAGVVQERLIVLAVGVHLGLFGGCEPVKAMLGLVEQLLFFFFCHDLFSFMIVSSNSSALRKNSSREAQSFVMAYWQRAL